MRKLYLFLIVLISLCSLNEITAQSFFPLEVGNEWHFDYTYLPYGFGHPGVEKDTFAVRVQSDTTMLNGYSYFMFDGTVFFGAKYLRVDSNCIYVYDDKEDKDIKLIDLAVELGDSREVEFKYFSSVTLIYVDSSDVFGYPSITKVFELDGLIINNIALSNKFGPISMWSPGEPPGSSYTSEHLLGCIISDTSYGQLVSVKENNQKQIYFTLSQNYPNPFNPTTIIQYQVSSISKVSLKVYDVLGREISTIVNEVKQPGSYEIEFDGSDLTSGVYFYVLESGDIRLSRKMLLLK